MKTCNGYAIVAIKHNKFHVIYSNFDKKPSYYDIKQELEYHGWTVVMLPLLEIKDLREIKSFEE